MTVKYLERKSQNKKKTRFRRGVQNTYQYKGRHTLGVGGGEGGNVSGTCYSDSFPNVTSPFCQTNCFTDKVLSLQYVA